MTRVGIFGIGLIGGSVGLAARAAGMRVTGADRDAAALRVARERRAIDDTAPDLAALAAGCDVLVLAVDLDATLDALAALRAAPAGASLVLDVASVKAPVAAVGAGVAEFVASHPIAGRERAGVAAAEADLFCDAPWVLVPSGDEARDARAAAFVRALGAVPLAMEAGEHDAAVARTSHLPQLLAWALAAEIGDALAAQPSLACVHGTGLASAVRLARSPWPMWGTILRANAAAVAPAVRSLAERLTGLADALDAGNFAPLASCSESGRRALDALDLAAERERSTPAVRFSRYRTTDDDPR